MPTEVREIGSASRRTRRFATKYEQGKAARIANASATESRSQVGRRGGRAEDFEDRTKDELLERAREIGIPGRRSMTKSELINALRNH